MEGGAVETRGNSLLRTNWGQTFGIALVGGAAAFALEYVRVDPTFGVGVALWLFFPLVVLSLCGGFAAMGSAAVAVTLQYSLSDHALSAFDAAIYLFTVTACCLVVWRTRQMRIVDGVLLSWAAVIPANVIYHQALFQYGLNAGILELSSDLMSQLIPAMLAQWLAMRPFPLAPLFPRLSSTMATKPYGLAVVIRLLQLPIVLLLLLASIEFVATQSLYQRVELERSLALQRAHSVMVVAKSVLEGTSFSQQDALEEQVVEELLRAMAVSASFVETGLTQKVDEAAQPESDATDREKLKTVDLGPSKSGLRIDLLFDAYETPPVAQPAIVITPSTQQRDRSPIDWVYQREWMVEEPFTPDFRSGTVRISGQVANPVAVNYWAMMWGLLATFVLLGGLLGIYQRWVRRAGESVRQSLRQFAAWQPGDNIVLSLPFERGLIDDVDSVRDNLQGLIDKFNSNYHELNASNARREQLLNQLKTIYSAINEPIIVVSQGFQLNESLSNQAGIDWGRRLQSDLAQVKRALFAEKPQSAEIRPMSKFASILLAELQEGVSRDKSAIRLCSETGEQTDFYVSVGAISKKESDGSAVENSGVEGDIVILLSDVSENIAARKALEHQSKITALEDLATGIAHELNQPLNIIRLGLANIEQRAARKTLDGSALAHKIERLNEQVTRMGVLIKAMGVYSAFENANPKAIDPCVILADVLATMNHDLVTHHITVETVYDAGSHCVVANDKYLGRLFAEVLGNASDALKAVDVEVRKLFVRQYTDKHYWIVEIEDGGEGFMEEDENRLFEPFYTTRQDAEHAGLGLTTARHIVSDLGGTITVERRAHRTLATIRLPLELASA